MTPRSFPGGASSREPACQCGRCIRDMSLILGQRSPGGEVATHSDILAWEITRAEEPSKGYIPGVTQELDTTEAP